MEIGRGTDHVRHQRQPPGLEPDNRPESMLRIELHPARLPEDRRQFGHDRHDAAIEASKEQQGVGREGAGSSKQQGRQRKNARADDRVEIDDDSARKTDRARRLLIVTDGPPLHRTRPRPRRLDFGRRL